MVFIWNQPYNELLSDVIQFGPYKISMESKKGNRVAEWAITLIHRSAFSFYGYVCSYVSPLFPVLCTIFHFMSFCYSLWTWGIEAGDTGQEKHWESISWFIILKILLGLQKHSKLFFMKKCKTTHFPCRGDADLVVPVFGLDNFLHNFHNTSLPAFRDIQQK